MGSASQHATTSSTVTLVRKYLREWGLAQRSALEEATRRVVAEASADGASLPGQDASERAISLARRWVEDFIRPAVAQRAAADAFWRARSLLARFPSALLATPLPSADDLGKAAHEPIAPVLPDSAYCPVKQQTICLAMHRLQAAVRRFSEPLRSLVGRPENG